MRNHNNRKRRYYRNWYPCPCPECGGHSQYQKSSQYAITPRSPTQRGKCPSGYHDDIRTCCRGNGTERLLDNLVDNKTRIAQIQLRGSSQVTSGLPVGLGQ